MAIVDPNSLTIDSRKLLKLSVSDRNQMMSYPGFRDQIMAALTPYQIATLFPEYYKQSIGTGGGGNLSSGLSGMTPTQGIGGGGTAAPLPSFGQAQQSKITIPPISGMRPAWVQRVVDLAARKDPSIRLTPAPKVSGIGNPLSNQRMRATSQLSQDQKIHMYALTMAEVGRSNPAAQRALMETIYNRYTAQKKSSLSSTMQADYYEPLRPGTKGWISYNRAKAELQNNPELFEQMDLRHNEVLAGSNDSNYSTHNGSSTVAADARRTQTIGAELGGETFSRKDNPKFQKHGAGNIKNEGDWYKSTLSEMQAFERGQSIANATEVVEQNAEKTGNIMPDQAPGGGPTLGPATSAGTQQRPLAMDPQALNALNLQRPGHVKGNLTFEGDDSTAFQFGSGGARNSRGSVPYGTYEIMPGLHQHSKYKSFENNSFYVKDMFDPQVGDMRSGILLHQASDWQNLYTHGCLGIRPDQWPAFKAKMLEYQKNSGGGPVYLIHTPQGAKITTTRPTGIDFQTANQATKDRMDLPPGANPGLAAANLSKLPAGLPEGMIKEFATLSASDQEQLIKSFNALGPTDLAAITQAYNQDVASRPEIKSEKLIEAIKNAPPGELPSIVSPITGTVAGGGASTYGAGRDGGHRSHSGVDWQAENGSPVVSMTGGKVLHVGNDPGGYDNYVNVLGDDGVVRRYASHGPVNVKPGERVQQGQQIATIDRGHLHYEEIPKTLNGQPNPVYDEFIKNGNAATSHQRGTRDPLVSNNLPAKTKVTAGQPFMQPPPEVIAQPETAVPIQPQGRPTLGPTESAGSVGTETSYGPQGSIVPQPEQLTVTPPPITRFQDMDLGGAKMPSFTPQELEAINLTPGAAEKIAQGIRDNPLSKSFLATPDRIRKAIIKESPELNQFSKLTPEDQQKALEGLRAQQQQQVAPVQEQTAPPSEPTATPIQVAPETATNPTGGNLPAYSHGGTVGEDLTVYKNQTGEPVATASSGEKLEVTPSQRQNSTEIARKDIETVQQKNADIRNENVAKNAGAMVSGQNDISEAQQRKSMVGMNYNNYMDDNSSGSSSRAYKRTGFLSPESTSRLGSNFNA